MDSKRRNIQTIEQKESRGRSQHRLIGVMLVLIILISIFFYGRNTYTSFIEAFELVSTQTPLNSHISLAQRLKDNKALTFLVIGVQKSFVDQVEGQRASLVMTATLNPELEQGLLLNYSKEIAVNAPRSLAVGTLEDTYTYGRVELTHSTIQSYLDKDIDFTVVVKFDEIRPLLNEVGDLEVVVPCDFEIDGELYKQNDTVTLTPRKQMLWLLGEADVDKEELSYRQMAILESLISKLINLRELPKLSTYLESASSAIETDLTVSQLNTLLRNKHLTTNYNIINKNVNGTAQNSQTANGEKLVEVLSSSDIEEINSWVNDLYKKPETD